MKYLSRCPCESHLATQLIDRSYSMSVERLFDYIFGDNDFLLAYRTSRRIKGFFVFVFFFLISIVLYRLSSRRMGSEC
jgi:hypothetical protein